MSETSPAPEPQINPVVSALSDFSDRISPVIVKELRQGLRTRTFTGIFLILQVVLGLAMLGAGMIESDDTGEVISNMVFFVFSVAALILQPLRGITAVSTELKEDTLELMALTRLTTSRIVLGKWASLVSQTALLLAATIPYLVMRYFFGGMQLFAELALLVSIFYLSVCLTAVTVGFSCSRSVVLRALVPLLLIPAGLSVIPSLIFGRQSRFLERFFSFQDPEALVIFSVWVVAFGYLGYYFLAMGVGRIAAFAENHALRKRLVSLGVMAGILGVMLLNPPAHEGAVFVMLGFVTLMGLDVCTEVPVRVPSVVMPFVKRGWRGKWLGRFFYPGWHTGLLLLLLVWIAAVVVGEITYSEFSIGATERIGLTEELWLLLLGMLYSILLPLLVVRVFITKIKDVFPGYIMVVVLSAMLSTLVGVFCQLSRSGGEGLMFLTSWIPGVWVLFMDDHAVEGVVVTSAFLLATLLALGMLARREFQKTAALEATAEEALESGER